MKFGVLDIENDRQGNVTEIGSCTWEGQPEIWSGVRAWDKWYRWAIGTSITRWYAHNGGGWDWLSLIHHACSEPGDWRFTKVLSANCVGTRPVLIRFEQLELCDSWCLTQCSLDRFAKEMNTHPKQSVDKLPWDMAKAERMSYLRDDCLALRDALNKFFELLANEGYSGKRTPITIAGAAWKIWRYNYAPNTYERLSNEGDIHCRQGYKGGRVEVFKPGEHHSVNVYDVNSMYPFVMVEELYPVGQPDNTDTYNRQPGAWRVGTVSDPASVLQFKAEEGDVVYTPEIERIHYTGGEVEVISGMYWEDQRPIFKEYVDHFYEFKRDGGPMGFVAKMLLNHLYGKLGSRPESSSMERLNDDLLAKIMARGYDVHPLSIADDQNDWWVVDRITPWRREHVAVAGLVTSYARVHLHRLIDKDTIYTDTDSIHTPAQMETSNELGGVKLECGPATGVYLGRKCYALKTDKGYEKIRLKGISQKGLTEPIDYTDVAECLHNPRTLTSLRPATLKETLAGIQPCSLVRDTDGGVARERKRTLRVTA